MRELMARSPLPSYFLLVLAVVTQVASGTTLRDCFYCLTDELPNAIQCSTDTPACDLSACGIGTDYVDFEACGCTSCIEPIFACFDACTPDCLDTVVDDFVTCMVTPDCYEPCNAEESTGEQQEAVLPPLETPEPCSMFEMLDDPVQCLFPIFPTCEVVQSDFVGVTCDYVSCCSTCYTEMTNVFSCFYNWASGYDCAFTCAGSGGAVRHLLGEREQEERQDFSSQPLLGAAMSHYVKKGYKRSQGQHAERKLKSAFNETDLEFVEECRRLISRDVVEQPEDIISAYMDCIVTHTMELVTSEANKPKATSTEGAGDPDNQDAAGTTGSGDSSSANVYNYHSVTGNMGSIILSLMAIAQAIVL